MWFPLIVGSRAVEDTDGLGDIVIVADSERSELRDAVIDDIPDSDELPEPIARLAVRDGRGLSVRAGDNVTASRRAVPDTATERESLGDEDDEFAGDTVEIDDTEEVSDRDAREVDDANALDEKEFSVVNEPVALP